MKMKFTPGKILGALLLLIFSYSQAQTTTWLGGDNYWNTPENWTSGVPTLTTDVIIPAGLDNYPQITGEDGVADCRNLTIEAGASVLVDGGGNGNLRIAGTISNAGDLDVSDGTLVMTGNTMQTIPANAFTDNTIRNLTVYNAISVSLDGELNLTGILSLETGIFITNDYLTLKSSASGTAIVNEVTMGTITGNITVERFIPARRAFRFISSPTTGGTIYSNWQESGDNTAGYGTQITGEGGEDNGFDESGSNNPSLFVHNNSTTTWEAVTTTTGTSLIAGKPYRLFVRGDRTIDLTSNASPATNTTLRTTGALTIGNVLVTDIKPEGGAFSLVGNPYQAPVDMEAVLNSSTNLNTDYYYMWDPTLNERGAYVTVNVVANTNNVSGSEASKYLQPEQAFFVQTKLTAPASLMFSESDKYITTNDNANVYRSGNNETAQIKLAMSTAGAYANSGPVADGFVLLFNNAYTNSVDAKDAVKPVNLDENVGTVNSGQTFSFESRAMPTATDIIPMHNDNYRTTDYVYSVTVSGLDDRTPYLHDKYNGNITELTNGQTTVYNFSIDPADNASSAPDRFEITFEDSALANNNFTSDSFSIYPNPVTGNSFSVLLPDTTKTDVKLYNSIGQEIGCRTDENGNTLQVYPETSLAAGIYIVQLNHGNKITSQKLIVK